MDQKNVIRPRNYLYEVLVILNGVVLIGIWWLILGNLRHGALAGCISYLALAWALRMTFQRHHRKGMFMLGRGNYAAAAECFQKSYAFFRKHPNVDKFRFITMFSSSAIPYGQMALNNKGLCHLYLGEDQKALEAFQELACLNKDYPNVDRTVEELQKHIREAQQQNENS